MSKSTIIFLLSTIFLTTEVRSQCDSNFTPFFGGTVSNAGDVNNDGFQDFIFSRTNRLFIISGLALDTLYTHSNKTYFKHSSVGDVNNDGFDDYMASQTSYDNGRGKVTVFSGATHTVLYTLLGSDTTTRFGLSLAPAGDVNHDGYDDFIIGEPYNRDKGISAGKVYLYSGKDGSVIYSFYPLFKRSEFGRTVSGNGDVNKDGYNDIVVTSSHQQNKASVHIYSGIDGSELYKFVAETRVDGFGQATDITKDFNLDGYNDILIGASKYDSSYQDAGKIYCYSGKDGSLLFEKLNPTDDGSFGVFLIAIPDFNNDNTPDIFVGSPGYSTTTSRTFIISGDDQTILKEFFSNPPEDRLGKTAAFLKGDNQSPKLVIEAKYYNRAGSDIYIFSDLSHYCCCEGLRGNVDGLGDPNMPDIADIIYFVSHTYLQPKGPAPPCFDEADVDASGQLDVSDLIKLVLHVFNITVPGGYEIKNCP